MYVQADHVRDATVLDIQHIVALGAKMHAESRYAQYPYRPDKIQRLIASLIHSPNGIVLVSPNGMLFGCVDEWWFADGLYAAEMVLYVEPEHRKSRQGYELVKAYVETAKAKGVQEIMIENSTGYEDEGVERFFERCGFTRVGGNFTMEV